MPKEEEKLPKVKVSLLNYMAGGRLVSVKLPKDPNIPVRLQKERSRGTGSHKIRVDIKEGDAEGGDCNNTHVHICKVHKSKKKSLSNAPSLEDATDKNQLSKPNPEPADSPVNDETKPTDIKVPETTNKEATTEVPTEAQQDVVPPDEDNDKAKPAAENLNKPSHANLGTDDKGAWTPEQDTLLLALKAQNRSWKDIVAEIGAGKSKKDLVNRFKELGSRDKNEAAAMSKDDIIVEVEDEIPLMSVSLFDDGNDEGGNPFDNMDFGDTFAGLADEPKGDEKKGDEGDTKEKKVTWGEEVKEKVKTPPVNAKKKGRRGRGGNATVKSKTSIDGENNGAWGDQDVKDKDKTFANVDPHINLNIDTTHTPVNRFRLLPTHEASHEPGWTLTPDSLWTADDCTALETLLHRYEDNKWLHIQAGFYNWTGRMVKGEFIKKKVEGDRGF